MKYLGLACVTWLALAGCEASVQSRPATTTAYEPAPAPPPRPPQRDVAWRALADRYSADSKAQQILLRGQGEFRKLRVEGARGAPMIEKITVDYDDNSAPQIITINERLSPGEGKTIDLNGGRRQIKRVIVYTAPEMGGSYSLFGA